jgi:hypothetical protein
MAEQPPDDLSRPAPVRQGRISAGSIVLLALFAALVGAELGFRLGGVLASVLICRGGDGSLADGEGCGMSIILFSYVGVPVGALIGVVAATVWGVHRRRTS